MQHNDLVVRFLKSVSGSAVVSEVEGRISSGFAEGRAYRINYRETLPQGGGGVVLKYEVGGDTVLTLSTLEVQQGGVTYEVYTQDGVTEDTSFTGTLPIFPRNTLSTNPQLGTPSNVVIRTDGTATFTGEPNATLDLRTPTSGGARASVTGGDSTVRGFGPTTIYLRIAPLEGINVDTKFTLKQEWIDI